MEEPDFASGTIDLFTMNAAILGLGLMGGSMAMALQGKVKTLTGFDPDATTRKLACEKKLCDRIEAIPADALIHADLIILAMPVRQIIQTLQELPVLHTGRAIVLDLGSTKVEIMQAMNILPKGFDPIGGHPMCGKEKSSIAAADPEIFINNAFIFTRLQRTSASACSIANQLADALLSFPIWLDAATHDRWVASTSHLPYIAACALVSSTPLESAQVAGTGYSSTTRIASTGPEVMLDVLMTNRENILARINTYRNNFDLFQSALEAEDSAALLKLLQASASHQSRILTARRLAGMS